MQNHHSQPPRRRSRLAAALGLVAGLASFAALAQDELNVLGWCDHTDPALVEPFEQANGVRVNTKEFEGTGTALGILRQSRPGDWDVLVLDTPDVRQVAGMKLLAPLDPGSLPLDDIPESIRLLEYQQIDGQLYAITEKFGYNATAFNRGAVSEAEARDPELPWNPKFKGRIAVYDYYLPVIAQVALTLGIPPQELSLENLPKVREKLLAMKPNIALIGDVTTSQTALATGSVDVIVGGGEYVVAGLPDANLDWVLPDGGGVRWQQSVAILADSEQKDLAQKYVQYILSPEGQARLATSSCYWGMPANRQAALSEAQKTTLRWDEQPAFIAQSHPYPAPGREVDRAMRDLWTEFRGQ